eukprot:6185010-Pyramimonas_sp.AAC.1
MCIRDSQLNLQYTFKKWCDQTNCVDTGDCVGLGFWGDSAPMSKRESLRIFLFSAVSGSHRDRFWATTFTRAQACQCGCSGLLAS